MFGLLAHTCPRKQICLISGFCFTYPNPILLASSVRETWPIVGCDAMLALFCQGCSMRSVRMSLRRRSVSILGMLSLATNKLTQTQRHKETKKRKWGEALKMAMGAYLTPPFQVVFKHMESLSTASTPYPWSKRNSSGILRKSSIRTTCNLPLQVEKHVNQSKWWL